MIRLLPAGLLALLVAAGVPGIALASRPVPKVVTACVVGGKFTRGPYTYQVRRHSAVGIVDVDLSAYEGKRIRVRGSLLPGDRLIAKSIEIVPGKCP